MAIWSKRPGSRTEPIIAYRQMDPAFPPLWYGAGRVTQRQASGRWHEEGKGLAQYLSLSSHGAWAELIRYEGIRDDNRRREHRRRLCLIQVCDHEIADLSSFDRYVEAGLEPELAIGHHHNCWSLAEDLLDAGFDGVLSPSAAYDIEGAVNLTLFGEKFEAWISGQMPDPGSLVRPRRFLPTVEVSEEAIPTRRAMENACYRSEDHRVFAAWCARYGHTPSW